MLEPLFSSEYCEIFKDTYFEEHLLLKMCSWNWEKLKNTHKELQLYINRFFQRQYQKLVKMFVSVSWLASHEVCIHIQWFFGVVRNKFQTWRCLIYVVLTTSNLRRLENVWFTSSSGRLIYDVLKTSDLRRLEGIQFTTSWRGLIYDALKAPDLWRLEDVCKTTSV